MNDLKLAIFDMDGLLLDTERWSVWAFEQIAEEMNLTLDADAFKKRMGRKNHNDADMREIMLGSERLDPLLLKKQVFKRLEELKKALYQSGARLRPGVKEIVEYLKENGILCVIASSSFRDKVTSLMSKTEISELFADYICGDDIVNGKPDPEIFLTACQRQGVSVENAIVFEDSDNGALAALRAGIRYILVPDIAYVSPESRNHALAVVAQINEAITNLRNTFGNLR